MDNLVREVVALFREAVEREGSSWDSARIPFEVGVGSIAAGVAYISTGVDQTSIFLDISRSAELAAALCSALTELTGKLVSRARVEVRSDWSTTVEHFGPRANPEDQNVNFGVWPDDPGYDGPVYVKPAIVRSPHFHAYRPVPGVGADVGISLSRIRVWFEQHAPDLAGMLNRPASSERIDEVEELLGARFSKSLRAAYLVHDGQAGSRGPSRIFQQLGWHPLDTAVEVMDGLNEVPGPRDDVKFIPVMHNGPATPVYVESIDGEDIEAPVV